MLPRANCVVLLLLCGALLTVGPGAAQGPEPQGAAPVREAVSRLLEAFAREDTATLAASWGAQDPSRTTFDLFMRESFAGFADSEVREPTFSRWQITDGRASVRVRFLWKRRPSAEQRTETPTAVWDLELVRAGSAWKLARWTDALTAFALEYVRRGAREPRESRAQLLQAERELVLPETLRTFHATAIGLAQQGNVPIALRINELAQEVAEAAGRMEEGWGWLTRGHILSIQSRHDESATLYRKALEVFQDTGDRLGQAETLNGLGALEQSRGRLTEALALLQENAKLAKELDRPAMVAQAQNNLGMVYAARSEFPEALAAYELALEIIGRSGDRAAEIETRNNVGEVHRLMGRFAEAAVAYAENLRVSRELKLKPLEAASRNNLGLVTLSWSRYEDAANHLNAALALYREIGDPAGEAMALTNLSLVGLRTGDVGEALRLLEEGGARFRKLGQRREECAVLQNMGVLYNTVRRMPDALRVLEQALQLSRTSGDRQEQARALLERGHARAARGEHGDAFEDYQASNRLAREVGDRSGERLTLTSIANLHLQASDYAVASTLLTSALAGARAQKERDAEAKILTSLGVMYQRMGRLTEAKQQYELAGKLAVEIRDLEVAFTAETGIGSVHQQQKQWPEATAAFRRAIEVAEDLRLRARERTLQTSLFEQYTAPYYLLAQGLVELRKPAESLAAAERVRARTLADLLEQGQVRVTRAMSEQERKEDAALREEVLAQSVHMRNARNLPTDRQIELEKKLEETQARYEELQRRIYLRQPELQIQRAQFEPAGLVLINRTLFAAEPKLCVLSYLVGDSETLLFALTRGAPGGPAALTVHRIPISSKDLREQCDALWQACSRDGGDYRAPARALYDRLLLPAAARLAGRTHVVVVPDGPLDVVPFHALLDGTGRHLVESAAVSYAPSVTALVKALAASDTRRPARRAGPALFAVGRPNFGGDLGDLPESETEVRSLSALFGSQAVVRLGAAASEAAARSEMARARYLHFATHGILNEAAPMYSALALTRGPSDDGRLQARELAEMELSAEMAVLSACETARGQEVQGEGVVGLTWAFFVAGVPTTVATQWKVADTSTRALMVQFYSRLPGAKPPTPAAAGQKSPAASKGKAQAAPPVLSRAEALRQAQLSLLRGGKYRHPYYWAPFVLLGDWRK